MAAFATGCYVEGPVEDPDLGPEFEPLACSGEQHQIAKRKKQDGCGNGKKLAVAESKEYQYCVYDKSVAPKGAFGDCRVSPQAESDEGLLPEDWRLLFELAVGYQDPRLSPGTMDQQVATDVDVANEEAGENDADVMIAVIDTAGPEITYGAGISPHGPMMAAIVRDLAGGCVLGFGEGECNRTVRTYVGLSPSGYGHSSTVAEGVHSALQEWKTRKAGGKDELLIINLSLAWPNQWKTQAAAQRLDPAYEMLERAVCNGALILAASGNRSPHECDQGLVAPAAWEQFSRPDSDRCRFLGEPYVTSTVLPNTEYRPLVHAISAVDGSRRPLLNSLAAAPVAAHGHRAVAYDGSTMFGPMTGTSVSTAVVSGIAARMWSQNPTLDGDQIMNTIWTTGTGNGLATLFLGSAPPDQRVVSLCTAFGLPCSPPSPPQLMNSAANQTVIGELRASPTCEKKPPPPPSADPVAMPQPSRNVCPSCYLDWAPTGDAQVHLQLASDYSAPYYTPVAIWITVYDDVRGTQETVYYSPTQLPINSYQMKSYILPELDLVGTASTGTTPTRAWIQVYFTTNQSPPQTVSAGDDLPFF